MVPWFASAVQRLKRHRCAKLGMGRKKCAHLALCWGQFKGLAARLINGNFVSNPERSPQYPGDLTSPQNDKGCTCD